MSRFAFKPGHPIKRDTLIRVMQLCFGDYRVLTKFVHERTGEAFDGRELVKTIEVPVSPMTLDFGGGRLLIAMKDGKTVLKCASDDDESCAMFANLRNAKTRVKQNLSP